MCETVNGKENGNTHSVSYLFHYPTFLITWGVRCLVSEGMQNTQSCWRQVVLPFYL